MKSGSRPRRHPPQGDRGFESLLPPAKESATNRVLRVTHRMPAKVHSNPEDLATLELKLRGSPGRWTAGRSTLTDICSRDHAATTSSRKSGTPSLGGFEDFRAAAIRSRYIPSRSPRPRCEPHAARSQCGRGKAFVPNKPVPLIREGEARRQPRFSRVWYFADRTWRARTPEETPSASINRELAAKISAAYDRPVSARAGATTLITDALSWRWIFYVVDDIPVCALMPRSQYSPNPEATRT